MADSLAGISIDILILTFLYHSSFWLH